MILPLAALLLTGCPSAYQRTYDQKTAQLEQQQQQTDAQQAQLHAQASKYAAVIYFATGSAVIDQDGIRQLNWFVAQMKPYPQANFLVQGFTDDVGSEANNRQLSTQRAQAVALYLQSQSIDPSRLAVQGFGTDYAAAPNATAQGRRNNRRVELTVR